MTCVFSDNRLNKDETQTESLNTDPILNYVPKLDLQIDANLSKNKNGTIKCEEEYCFALWNIDYTNNTKLILQGCWDHPDRPDCRDSNCIAKIPLQPESMRNTTRFCCCHGNECNRFVIDNIDISMKSAVKYSAKQIDNYSDPLTNPPIIFLTAACILSTIIICAVAIFALYRNRKGQKRMGRKEKDLFLKKRGQQDFGHLIDITLFKEFELISRGRYGNVYKANYNETNFAIKTFNPGHENYFLNEVSMYNLPSLSHPNIIPFIGHFNVQSAALLNLQYAVNSKTQCLNGAKCGFVNSYASNGSLCELLKRETIDWKIFCSMAQGLASALNCLHCEYTPLGHMKPMIVHRDINSRNILVTATMEACLCDFGFATEVGMADRSHLRLAVHPSILPKDTNVGTIRYMAPEILEGCVNLGENRISLKQVDVYAFALVLWELASRCHDLYPAEHAVPEFRLAFEAELGTHPSYNDMQNNITRKKLRPKFCSIWKNTNSVAKMLVRTIEECWDDDAEARLSSGTILQRLLQLNGSTPQTVGEVGTKDQPSSFPRLPLSDTTNFDSACLTMDTVGMDTERLHRVDTITGTRSDGNSSGIGGLSGESTLSFDRPQLVTDSNNVFVKTTPSKLPDNYYSSNYQCDIPDNHFYVSNYQRDIPVCDYNNHKLYVSSCNDCLSPAPNSNMPFVLSDGCAMMGEGDKFNNRGKGSAFWKRFTNFIFSRKV